MTDLTAAGLSQTEAKCYAALLEQKEWKPADLAKSINETRTNTYKILDNLVAMGLAERFDKEKKLHFRATNPTRLLEMARERRLQLEASEKELEIQTEALIREFAKHNEQPGIRYFHGKDAIQTLLLDINQGNREAVAISPKARGKHPEIEKIQYIWLDEDYSSPVEWIVSDDTLYAISYGEETVGMAIRSHQFAASFKQIYNKLGKDQHIA